MGERKTERVGEFTITHIPELEMATVTRQGALVPEVIHSADGPDAFEKCKAWARGDAGLIQTDRQLTEEEAVRLYESKFWEGMEAYDIALFQMFQNRLCLPFDAFHKAVEEALGRPVWTHEFGLNHAGLKEELLGLRPKPSMADILDLIPEEKRMVIEVGAADGAD